VQLDQFAIQRSFQRLREDLGRLGHGAHMVEAVLRLTPERDPHPACFALLLRSLRALETERPGRVQLAFTLRLLDLLGHRPRLDRCGACGARVGTTALGFDAAAGTVCCARCRGPGGTGVSPRALGALRGLQAAPWEARLRAQIPAGVEAEASAVLVGYVRALCGSALRSTRFLAWALSESDADPASPG
jgi:DNA repair protein RecO (recombination protein O)